MAKLDDESMSDVVRLAAWNPRPLRRVDSPEEFPAWRLPGCIGQAVREVVDYVQAPIPLVAASALSVVSAAVQTQHSVSRDARMHGPATLYFLTVAESGERKSTVDTLFMKPIREWEARQRREAARLEDEYRDELAAWEAADGDRGPKPEKPAATPKMLRGDDTPEALVRHLSGYPIAAVISAEAGVIFGSHAMSTDSVQKNLGQANQLWDGGPIMEGRIGRGEVSIESAHVTMGLMVQPKVLQNFVAKTNGLARGIGYFARFLFCHPETTQGSRFYKEPPPMPGVEAFHRRVTELLRCPAVTNEFGQLATTVVGFDAAAQDVWVRFYDEVEGQMGGDEVYASIRDVASKAPENAARLACCLLVFTSPERLLIDADTMNAACALMRWYLDEAVRFGRDAATTPEVRNAELIEAWLVQKWKEATWARQEWRMTVNTIRRTGPNEIRSKGIIDDALELLQDHGRLRVLSIPGSKSKLVVIAPQVIEEYR